MAFGPVLRSVGRHSPRIPVHDAIDQLLSSNFRLEAFTTMLVLAHAVAGFWAWRRGDLIPVLALNALFAAMVLIYQAPRLAMSIVSQDTAVLGLLAFEALGLVGSVVALCGLSVPRSLVWLVFGANAVISAAFMLFAFTFRITKLF
jgi:hypothetical protein